MSSFMHPTNIPSNLSTDPFLVDSILFVLFCDLTRNGTVATGFKLSTEACRAHRHLLTMFYRHFPQEGEQLTWKQNDLPV